MSKILKEKLQKAEELYNLINTTEKALRDIPKDFTKNSEDDCLYKEGTYNLNVSEHSDGSGWNLDLSRYYGNGKILMLIKKELEEQLAYFYSEVEKL